MSEQPLELDDPQAVIDADHQGLLFDLAYSGAQVRQTLSMLRSGGIRQLDSSATRNLVVLTGDGLVDAPSAVRAMSELLGGPPVTISDVLTSGHPWLGPADTVLVLSGYGMEQTLVDSLGVASARGCDVIVLAPEGSALQHSAAATRSRWLPLPDAQRAGIFWSAMSLIAHLGGAAHIGDLADELEHTAEACGPVTPRARNAAKVMGQYAASQGALVVGEDDVSSSAARLLSAKTLAWAGVPVAVADVRRDEIGIERVIERSAGGQGADIFFDPDIDDVPQHSTVRLIVLAHSPASEQQRRVAERAARARVDVVLGQPSAHEPPAGAAQLYLQAHIAAAYAAVLSA